MSFSNAISSKTKQQRGSKNAPYQPIKDLF
jgi:hypothetical protein